MTSKPDGWREARIARWFDLTRRVLPGMAATHRWPIRHDHCFMRVCLDEAIGSPWSTVLRRPAIRTMTDDQLASAIAVAEAIVENPEMLGALNDASLASRRASR